MADNTANTPAEVQPITNASTNAPGTFDPTKNSNNILKAQSPTGLVPIPAPGSVWAYFTPLKATDQPVTSGRLYYNGATAIAYQIVCDVPFMFRVNYYKNGRKLSFTPNPVNYDPAIISSHQSALNVKGDCVEFILTPIGDQTILEFTVDFSQGVQPTTSSSALMITDTNNAVVNKSTHQARENGTGARKEITGTTVGNKFGKDVNLLNPVDNSLLAKDATLKSGDAKTQVTNFPAIQNIAGNVGVTGSLPAGTANIGKVTVEPDIANPIPVIGNFYPVTQPVSGTIAVSNLPATQQVSGSVGVNNFPATQTIAGTVAVSNFPANTEITNDVGNPIPVNGTVAVSNTDYAKDATAATIATKLTDGTQKTQVTVLPSLPTGTNIIGQVQINGVPHVVVDTLPAITGTVSISGVPHVAVDSLPAIVLAAGSNSIGKVTVQPDAGNPLPVTGMFWQTTQPVSAAALPLPTGASTEASIQLLLTQLQGINADQGAPSDTAVTDFTATASEIALLKGIIKTLAAGITTTSGALTPKSFNYGTSGTTNGVQTLKTGTGAVGHIYCVNETANDIYIQFFDVATGATVTPGTTVPTFVYAVDNTVPLTATVNFAFTLGLKFCITTAYSGSTIITQAFLNLNYR